MGSSAHLNLCAPRLTFSLFLGPIGKKKDSKLSYVVAFIKFIWDILEGENGFMLWGRQGSMQITC